MTTRELIKGALRLINAIASGETPSADEEADALSVLNDILESWATSGLLIYSRTRESFPLSSVKQTWTMGPSGDFNTTWPSRISQVGIETNGNELPVQIINEQEWAAIGVKSTQSSLPMRIYADGSYPLLNLSLWPIPNVANNLIIYSLKPLSAISSLTATLSLPPGYARCLRYNLAGELAAEFGRPLDSVIANIAIESKADLMRQNTQPVYMKSDAIGLTNDQKPFNWITGE